jgi:hypothetical protein
MGGLVLNITKIWYYIHKIGNIALMVLFEMKI